MAVIELNTKFFPLAWVLYLCTPKASIDGGQPFPVPWRRPLQVPVAPGQHHVEVWVPYLFLTKMGKRGALVQVVEGGGVSISWEPAWYFVFAPGKLLVNGQPAPNVVANQGYAAQQYAAQPYQAQPLAQQAQPVPQQQVVGGGGGAWHPDPSGRHAQRYWDGTSWTQHVTDGGPSYVDPTPIGS